MSLVVSRLVWSNQDKSLGTLEVTILARMADYANDEGGSIFPSITRLTEETRISRSGVCRILKQLIVKGYLTVTVAGCSKTHRSNEYELNMTKLEQESRVKKPKTMSTLLANKDNIIYFYPVDKSTFSVDKPVDNLCTTTHPSVTITPGASVTITPGASATMTPHPSLTSIINNDHLLRGDTTNVFLKKDEVNVRERLRNWNVQAKDVDIWLARYGEGLLAKQISCISQVPGKIRNPGAVLRTSLKRLTGEYYA